VEIDVRSPAVPVLLLEMARVYNELGRGDLALNELEKARAMAVLIEGGQVA